MNNENINNILKEANNSNYVPGIYNYCDKWCEKCITTSKCLNFKLDSCDEISRNNLDDKNNKFWTKMENILKNTIELIQLLSTKKNIVLEYISTNNINSKINNLKDIRNIVKEKYLSKLSKQYIHSVQQWFDSSENSFIQKEDELNLKLNLKFPNSNPIEETNTIIQLIEIIRYYQHFIFPKLMRALEGKIFFMKENCNDRMYDANGSAKIVLIACDRSLAAWGEIMNIFEEWEDEILNILVLLQKMIKGIEKEFPNARNFIRPGLD